MKLLVVAALLLLAPSVTWAQSGAGEQDPLLTQLRAAREARLLAFDQAQKTRRERARIIDLRRAALRQLTQEGALLAHSPADAHGAGSVDRERGGREHAAATRTPGAGETAVQ